MCYWLLYASEKIIDGFDHTTWLESVRKLFPARSYIVLIKNIFYFIYCFVHYQDSVGWTGLQSFGLVQK